MHYLSQFRTVSYEAVYRHILDCCVGRTVKANFGKCTRTSTVAGVSSVLGFMTTSSGDIATNVPMVGLRKRSVKLEERDD